MKRLLKISLDTSIFSLVPVFSWFALGLLVNKNLINIFTLTYPIQFIYSIMVSIFAVGPNILKEKEKKTNVVMSSSVVGAIVGLIIFGFLAIRIDSYIEFMNMDVTMYHTFGIYSVIQLYIQLLFALILEKLYYEDKNTLANWYTISLNILNFIVLIVTALVFKNQIYIVSITLIVIFIYVLFVWIKEFQRFKLDLHLLKCIRYDSVDICENFFFFLIYLFGISTVASFGEEYIAAANFITLITDTQWDTIDAISTVAKIDISRGCFNYYEHRKNAYQLLGILVITILILMMIMMPFYELNFILVLLYLSVDMIHLLMYPIYRIKTCFLQLESSSLKITLNNFMISILRTILSFLETPFCTAIGQLVSAFYQFITIHFLFHKNYQVEKDGKVLRKSRDCYHKKDLI